MAQSPLFDWSFDIVSRCRDVFLRSGKWFRFRFGTVSWIGRKLSDNAALSLKVGVPIQGLPGLRFQDGSQVERESVTLRLSGAAKPLADGEAAFRIQSAAPARRHQIHRCWCLTTSARCVGFASPEKWLLNSPNWLRWSCVYDPARASAAAIDLPTGCRHRSSSRSAKYPISH